MTRLTPTAPHDQQAAQELVPCDSHSNPEALEIRLDDAKESDPPAINETISHYRISKKLGAGGMGEVFLAEDTTLHRKVAIKFLSAESAADERAKKRLTREAQAAAILDHPNICSIYEVSEESGRSFIAMQYVEGETLATRMRNKPLDLSECLEIAAQVADALVEAHSHGIIHRDIKPQNIMLTARHEAKLMDFGLAAVVHDRSLVDREAVTESLLTEPGAIVGTFPYMSPEQVRGESLDARSDIFSFGTVLYEMVTGHEAFGAESAAMIMSAIVSRNPAPLARFSRDVPSELERIVSKALRKDRDRRYQATSDLLIDLRSLKHHLEIEKELENSAAPGADEQATARRRSDFTTEHSSTSAEYQASEIKHYKRSVPSIAVLPFANMSADPGNDFFCDGLAEELLNSLTKLKGVYVAARTSAFSFKGKEIDVREIGRKLNVSTVLEGSFRKEADRIRVIVQLIGIEDGYHLWSERYDRQLTDVFEIQDEITFSIVHALKLKLLGEEQAALLKRYTDNAEAFQFYLRGRHFWNKRTGDGLRKAIGEFQQAIDLDPNYALAYAGLADSYVVLEPFAGTPASETLPKARAAVERALQLDDSLAEAHVSLGLIQQFSWNFGDAEREYKRAIELNQNCPTAYFYYGFFLNVVKGDFDEAMAQIRMAQRLDPLSPRISNEISHINTSKGELDAAQEAAKKVMELDPSFSGAHRVLGHVYLRRRRYDEAIAESKRAAVLSGRGGWELAGLGECYAMAGDRAGARAILKELEDKYDRGETLGQYIGEVYAALGDKERAIAWLERDFQARSGLLPMIAYAYWSDTLRDALSGDLRWNDLLRRIGLPQN